MTNPVYPNFGTFNVAPPLPIPATIAGGASYLSGFIPAGLGALSAACKLSQAGTLSVQRYADTAGTAPVGAVITATLVANTANYVSVSDGLPYMSFQVTIANTSGSSGNLTNTFILTGPLG